MSSTPHPPRGDNSRHMQAARNWLDRAEQQFSAGQSTIAAATLMLAQAELKIVVEGVAQATPRPESRPRTNPFRLVPVMRNAMAVASLAACLLMGILLGRAMAPGSPAGIATPGPIQIAQVEQPAEAPPAKVEQPVANPTEGPTVIEGGPSEVMAAETPAPASTHAPRYSHPRTSAAETSEPAPVEQPEPPVPVIAPPPLEPPEAAPIATAILPSEVALETIRALSERFLEGNQKQ